MNQCKNHNILCSSHPINTKISTNLSMHLGIRTHNKITIICITNRISTHHNNYTCKEGVVETSEAKEEEEDLVEEEVRLHAITVDNQVTIPDISWNL